MKPLSSFAIIESHSDQDAAPITEAIAFCGRILSDLGANIYLAGNHPEFADANSGKFLSAGKSYIPAGQDPESPPAALELRGAAPRGAATGSIRITMLPPGAPEIPVSEFTLMAASGLLDIVGDPARAPLRLPAAQLARSAGLAAFTVAAALLRARTAGEAQVSLLDTGIWLNWKSLVLARENGAAPSRLGRAAEWQVVACRDGWIGLVYREQDWPAVKALVGDPRLEDPGLDHRANRKRRAAEIAAIVEERLAGMTRAEVMAFASANRIPLGPVLTTAEVIADAQSRARGAFISTGGTLSPRLPVLWNGAPLLPGGAMT